MVLDDLGGDLMIPLLVDNAAAHIVVADIIDVADDNLIAPAAAAGENYVDCKAADDDIVVEVGFDDFVFQEDLENLSNCTLTDLIDANYL